MPVGPAKFDPNRCNESPLRGEKPDFWPVSKNDTGSLPLCGILPVMTFREILKKNAEGRVTYMASSCGYEFKYKGQMLGTQAGEWVG